MHTLHLPQRVDIGTGTEGIVEADEYIIDDVTGAQLLVLAGHGTMEPLKNTRPLPDSELGDGARVLFMRAGGFGDLVLMTPVLRALKAKWPTCHIAVCCFKDYSPVLANLPFVDELLPFPLTKTQAETYDAWVFYENAIERNPRAREIHATDLFAEIAGISLADADRRPEYRVKPTEAIWANEAYPRTTGLRRVCVQVGASGACRVYPKGKMGEVCRELVSRGVEVFLLGRKGEVRTPEKTPALLRNLAEADLTFRQSCAVLSQADGFLGADSALLHVAGALGIPSVGLYGAFPWKLRTAYCPTTHAIQGVPLGSMCPCFHHENAPLKNHFPVGCPTAARGFCGVLEGIEPKRIVAKVEQLAVLRIPAVNGEAQVVEFPR